MIQVTVFLSPDGSYKGFRLCGHAGYAESGNDIVCAAVSLLTINTINAIERFTDDPFTSDSDEDSGLIDFSFTGHVSGESKLLVDTMVLGIQELEDNNNEEYIDLIFEEV